MPGALFLHDVPSYQGTQAQGLPADAISPGTGVGGSHTSFIIWLAIIGVIIPGLIIGGLKYGGFQFVFRNR